MGMSDEAFEVMCPECMGVLKIDPVNAGRDRSYGCSAEEDL